MNFHMSPFVTGGDPFAPPERETVAQKPKSVTTLDLRRNRCEPEKTIAILTEKEQITRA
jgi:hypothetical protein